MPDTFDRLKPALADRSQVSRTPRDSPPFANSAFRSFQLLRNPNGGPADPYSASTSGTESSRIRQLAIRLLEMR